uniref:Uncharacterized protein n=1 Tax=Rhizophora mucronata TaxID=61149 RepID=A0A2P2QJG5_RHIMU
MAHIESISLPSIGNLRLTYSRFLIFMFKPVFLREVEILVLVQSPWWVLSATLGPTL